MPSKRHTFRKSERLKSIVVIKQLFDDGSMLKKYPIRLVYLVQTHDESILKAGVTVPRRSFKKAVDRNLLKRRMREAYRLSNAALKESLTEQGKHVSLMLIYTAREILDYQVIEKATKKLLNKLVKETATS